MKLTYPLVTMEAQVAVAEDLPVAGADFLLGNLLAGGRYSLPPMMFLRRNLRWQNKLVLSPGLYQDG